MVSVTIRLRFDFESGLLTSQQDSNTEDTFFCQLRKSEGAGAEKEHTDGKDHKQHGLITHKCMLSDTCHCPSIPDLRVLLFRILAHTVAWRSGDVNM